MRNSIEYDFVLQIVENARYHSSFQVDADHFEERAAGRGISLAELVNLQSRGDLYAIEPYDRGDQIKFPKVILIWSSPKGDYVVGVYGIDGCLLKGITCYRCPRGKLIR